MIFLLASEDFRIVATVAIVFLIAMALGYRLLNRDANVRRTRYGFFVERDRYRVDEPTDDLAEGDVEQSEWPERSEP